MKRDYFFLIAALVQIAITGALIDFEWRAPYWIATGFGAQFSLMLWGMSQISRIIYESERRASDRHADIMRKIGWL